MAEKSIRPEKVLRIIGLSLFGVAILLAFIGCFGDIFKTVSTATTSGVSTSYTQTTPFTWLFKDMWKELNVKSPVSSVSYAASYPYQLILSLLTMFSYIGCLAGVTTILILTLVNFVSKPGTDNVNVSKLSKLLVISIVPFLITIMMLKYGGSSQVARESDPSISSSIEANVMYGWGTILMIVGAIMGIVGNAFASVKDNISKNDIVHNILTKTSMVLLIFVAIFGFQNVIADNYQTSYYSIESRISLSRLLISCSQKITYTDPSTGSTIVKTAPGALTLAIFAMIFFIAIACFIVLAFKSKKTSARITFLACILGCSVLAGVLSQTAVNQLLSTLGSSTEETIKFGSGPLVTAILSGIALIITCVSTKFAAPEKEKAAPKKVVEKK